MKENRSKYFITGATGFIGQKLAIKLASQGHQVLALIRTPEKKHLLQHPNIEFVEGSLNDLEALDKGVAGCDYIFHLAAFARVWNKSPQAYTKINVEGTENILKTALKHQIKKVVVTSTAGVFGPSEKVPVDENIDRKVPFFNEYEETKHQSENICREYAKKGLHVVVVSPSRVYGPGIISESNAVTKLVNLYINKGWRWLPGDGNGIGNYVFVDDVVDGHLKALDKGRSGQSYLLGGENASYKTFFQTLAKVSGVRKRMIKAPINVLLFISNCMMGYTKITGNPPLITPKWVKKYLYHWAVSSQKAEKELGYTITPLESGLKQTVEWLSQSNTQKVYYTLITGASSGIGKALAHVCAQKGRNLVLVALPHTGLEELCQNLEMEYRVKVHCLCKDLTTPDSTKEIYQYCQENNLSINFLINNAGLGGVAAFAHSRQDEIQYMMTLNMHATVNLTRYFIHDLKKCGQGYILNVSSLISLFPLAYKSIYSATKGFVLNFSKSLYHELKDDNIMVSCLCPGPIPTNQKVKQTTRKMGWKGTFFVLTADKVAHEAYHKMLKKQFMIIPGWKNRVMVALSKFAPVSLILGRLGKNLKRQIVQS
jgi:short-subunit dehydrogenase